MVNHADPFDFLTNLCLIPDAQQDILRSTPFAGRPKSFPTSGPFSKVFYFRPIQIYKGTPPERLEGVEQRPMDLDDSAEAACSSSFAGLPKYFPASGSYSNVFHIQPTRIYRGTPPERLKGIEQRPMDVDDGSRQDAAAVSDGAEAAVGGGCMPDVDVSLGMDLGENPNRGFGSKVQSPQDEVEIIGVRRTRVAESGEPSSKRLKSRLDTSYSEPREKIVINLDSE